MTKGAEKLSKAMDLFMALVAVMVWWIYIYCQTHCIIYRKYVQLFAYHSFLSFLKKESHLVKFTAQVLFYFVLFWKASVVMVLH